MATMMRDLKRSKVKDFRYEKAENDDIRRGFKPKA